MSIARSARDGMRVMRARAPWRNRMMSGVTPGLGDLATAVIAASGNERFLTRNQRHFQDLDARVVNTFDGLPV